MEFLPNFFYFNLYLFIWLHCIFIAACEIQFPDQRSNLGPLRWHHGVLATEPPGKSDSQFFDPPTQMPPKAGHSPDRYRKQGHWVYEARFFQSKPAFARLIVLSHPVMSDSFRPHGLYVAYQAPLSTGFSWQEYWSGFPCPPPGDLPNPGIKPRSHTLQADSLLSEPPEKPKNTGVGSLSLLQGNFLTHINSYANIINKK